MQPRLAFTLLPHAYGTFLVLLVGVLVLFGLLGLGLRIKATVFLVLQHHAIDEALARGEHAELAGALAGPSVRRSNQLTLRRRLSSLLVRRQRPIILLVMSANTRQRHRCITLRLYELFVELGSYFRLALVHIGDELLRQRSLISLEAVRRDLFAQMRIRNLRL